MALKLKGSTSGFVAIDAPSVAGNNTLILPENTGSAQQLLGNDITAGVVTFTSVTVNRNGDLTVPGTISIGGTLTYEDVTSVDSIGIVTARGLSIFGNTTGLNATGVSTFTSDVFFLGASSKTITFDQSEGHIRYLDNAKAQFGTQGDLQLYHNGSHAYIDNSEGSLFIKSSNQVYIQDDQGRKQITCVDGAAVELYHAGVDSVRLQTTTTGVSVPTLNVTGISTFASTVDINGNTTFGANGSITSGANFTLSGNALTVTGSATVVGEFKGATIPTIQVTQTTNSTDLQLRANSTGGLVRTASNTPLVLGTNQQERMYITGAGLVGINSTSPSQMLDVYNNTNGVSAKVRVCAANGGQAGLELIAGSGSVNRASRIDFINMNTSSSPQWTIINDYQQNGGNHLGFYHGAEKGIVILPDSRVELYNDGLKRLETTASGVTVSDDGSNNLTLATNRFIVNRDEAYFFDQNNTGNSFIFRVSNSSGLDTNALQLYSQGHAYMISRSTSASSITVRKGVSGADSIDYIQCRANSNALKFVVEGDGDVKNSNNSYGQTSDSKLKENIVDANSQWNDIKAVKVRNFNFKESTGLPTLKQIGVVAQELETTSPNLVEESIDRDPDTGEDLGTTTKNVKYSILYMKAIKCLQEAITKIETLETKVAALEAA